MKGRWGVGRGGGGGEHRQTDRIYRDTLMLDRERREKGERHRQTARRTDREGVVGATHRGRQGIYID